MKSIDNLREYVLTAPSICSTTRAILVGYIDGIEREVADERIAAYNKGHDEGFDLGFVSADDWFAQHEDAMAEHGWVRLPVDANGDVLHIGELVDEELPFGGYAAPAPIDTMELSRGASGDRWMVKLDAENGAFINPKLLRHHHATTVEDVLREFADAWGEWKDGAAMMNPVETFAAKLRLVGDE